MSARKAILVVVDDAAVAECVVAFINEFAGVDVSLARDAEQALTSIDQHGVDLVFADLVSQHGIDSFGVAMIIARQYSELPVICASADRPASTGNTCCTV